MPEGPLFFYGIDQNRFKTKLKAIYFDIDKNVFVATPYAENPDADIKRCLRGCHHFFEYLVSQGIARHEDDCVFVQALTHKSPEWSKRSSELGKKRAHVTIKICSYQNLDNGEHAVKSSRSFHLFTDIAYCPGQYEMISVNKEETGWTKKIPNAKKRGTLCWNGTRHELKQMCDEQPKDIYNGVCNSNAKFVRLGMEEDKEKEEESKQK